MQPNISKNTKLKVIGGYVLLFLLTLLSTILIYKQITKLIVNEGNANDANRKLFIVSNTITGLYEAETLSNAFIQTGSNKYFQRYITIMDETGMYIDSLSYLTTHLDQILRLDTIRTLLNNKIRNLQDLVYVKRSFTPEEFYSKAIANIESNKDSLQEAINIRTRYITTLDSTYVRTERKKKRWFSKAEPDSVLNVTKSYHIIVDTLDNTLRNTDTVVNILRNTWQDVQKQSEDITRQINQKEYSLIKQSTEISDQLKRILGEYEKEEISLATLKQQNREHTVTTTIQIFAVVSVIAFLLVVFFTFFILRDLSRSQRYRRELENANQYTAQLLKSREKMILTVTHDIKSPLSSILGYIELLNDTPINNRQSYFLQNMKGSSEHILQLVRNLLDLSKLENNKMTIEEVSFNPVHLFQEIIDTFIPAATTKHLQLIGKFNESLNVECKGDLLRIRQIVTNILSNAVKYTEQGSIHFTASTTTDDKRMILKIKDTGAGMTPEEQKLIFEEFTRLKSHSSIEGTGLGLTITLKLIHLLNGEIKLQSKPNEGSCFTIFLPFHKTAIPTQSHSTEQSPVITGNTQKLKILLVDDDPLQLSMTSNLLAKQGIQTTSTTHAKEIISLLKSEHYDLLFSDIQMPEMNGFELVHSIRQADDSICNIPIIALSADSDKQEEEYLQAGFSAYLPKPFQSTQLINLINQLCGQKFRTSEITNIQTQNGYTLKNIQQFTDNDPKALMDILQSFIHSTEEHINLLKAACQRQQPDEIARIAHKMLPLFRQLEASNIVELLQHMEHPEKNDISELQIYEMTQTAIKQTIELIQKIKDQSIL